MPDEERKQANTQNRPDSPVRAGTLQEVDQAEIGQLRPNIPPAQEQQGWNRERALGVGEGRNQATQSQRPKLTFADTRTEDLSASGRETAVHLEQNRLGSLGDRDALNQQPQAEERQPDNAQERHRQHREQESTKEMEQEQQKEQNRER